jgi:hypothetical protein
MGLKKWASKIIGLILQIKNPMVLILNVEEVVEKKEKIIQSVFLLQKPHRMSQARKEASPLSEESAKPGNTGPKPANVPTTFAKRIKNGSWRY